MVRLLDSVLDLFLRSNCPLCDRPLQGDELCLACQRRLQDCRQPKRFQQWQGTPPLFAWGTYQGSLKRAIAALKYENQPQLARPLGHLMGDAWRQSPGLPKSLVVVPIPMHPEKQRQRGFNQAERLARYFCHLTGFPLAEKGLKRVKNTEALFSLTPQQRQQTLRRAIALGESFQRRPPRHPVLLFDDIYTTGTTTGEAIALLRQHQIPVAGVAVLAKTQGPSGPGSAP
ncbi:MAG: ComF family protein [Phormidium sp. GEM2.Bin31]|nr:MAG: ComF family protein [Phormidium sp. GEM2.Bin31]